MRQESSIAPLVTFRMVFGCLMLLSCTRFWALGWIEEQYIHTTVHFPYFGFEWVPVPPAPWIYLLWVGMALSSVGVIAGYRFRLSAWTLFVCFSWTELMDVTYYLNHYYFVSLALVLLALSPAHRHLSLDVRRRPETATERIPHFWIALIRFQLAVVYVFAGIAKWRHEWLIEALPLRIWLPAQSSLPVIGWLFELRYTPWLFSWAGMVFDTFVPLFLYLRKTRPLAYAAVVVFHTVTGMLFQIGVFPVVMIFSTPIFFSDAFHLRLQAPLRRLMPWGSAGHTTFYPLARHWLVFGSVWVAFQLLFPLRYLAYPGWTLWTEEGYRFGWRVMLVEKAGTALFRVRDGARGRDGFVDNSEFLNMHQEKQMSFQPDMILHYAHFLAREYRRRGMSNPEVRAEVWVTINGRPGRMLIDSSVNLAQQRDGWAPKTWILPFEREAR